MTEQALGRRGGQDIHICVDSWSHTLDSDSEVHWPLSVTGKGMNNRISAFNEVDHANESVLQIVQN